jgi:hypothetical protein
MELPDFNYTLKRELDGSITLEVFAMHSDGSATQTAVAKIQHDQISQFVVDLARAQTAANG